jgi:hypothetical protein
MGKEVNKMDHKYKIVPEPWGYRLTGCGKELEFSTLSEAAEVRAELEGTNKLPLDQSHTEACRQL